MLSSPTNLLPPPPSPHQPFCLLLKTPGSRHPIGDKHPPWRNWLARSTVNREVPGSSPGGGGVGGGFFLLGSSFFLGEAWEAEGFSPPGFLDGEARVFLRGRARRALVFRGLAFDPVEPPLYSYCRLTHGEGGLGMGLVWFASWSGAHGLMGVGGWFPSQGRRGSHIRLVPSGRREKGGAWLLEDEFRYLKSCPRHPDATPFRVHRWT
ncbi:hypothetical protein BJ875DRAFT_114582 [Amylocarpus encephaloides]|uniref:Uncharacterized protein n=1 Tax=Amylocarpus encephaloides TaxID=45428 RepID=A0A9P7YQ34_9HELO|nr:hypothetical protein BJ875DRAFT_114582 [Amylocarpus encephaloides]